MIFSDDFATIYHGNSLDVMGEMDAESVHVIVTDPPYGLSFMGRAWDHGVPGEPFWTEALRVAKPGAHLVAFGGTRTYHRLTCAIEDAGWEIRDCLGWLYGTGFPKSHNLKDEWQGWGTALKPAWEPIILARKPLSGTVAANVQTYGTGGINVDGCRVGAGGHLKWEQPRNMGYHGGSDSGNVNATEAPLGRWPANIIHDGSDEVLSVFPSSTSKSGSPRAGKNGKGRGMTATGAEYDDSGSAARFFYTAKASKAERGEGNTHPTVKPLALMRYLVRLVTPPEGVVLDPFMGSGTTLKAAQAEGFRSIGIDLEEEYCRIAKSRIGAPATKGEE